MTERDECWKVSRIFETYGVVIRLKLSMLTLHDVAGNDALALRNWSTPVMALLVRASAGTVRGRRSSI